MKINNLYSNCRGKIKYFLFILLLTGCQTPNISKDFKFNENEELKTGLIIGSVSQNLGNSKATVADFRIDYALKNKTKLLYSMDLNEVLGGFANKFGFEDENTGGRIFAVELDAGDHQLDYWSINHNQNSLVLYPKVPPPVLKFTLERGQIMYLGNFHINIESYKSLLGAKLPAAGVPSISSEYDRDVKYFHEKYPQFKGKEITVNVLHDGIWLDDIHNQEKLVIPTSK